MQLSDQDQQGLERGIAAFEDNAFARAMRLLHPLAAAGVADAQYRLAIMCQNGLGGARQPEEAAKWMRAAAEQGNAMAQYALGFIYMQGDCVQLDGPQAVHWLERAAEQGLSGAKTTLALMYAQGKGVERDPEVARRWYIAAGFDPDRMAALRD